MKKILKVIGIFTAVIGLIVGLSFISRSKSDNKHQTSGGQSTFSKLGNQYWDDWHRQNGWNANLFKKNLEEIDAKKHSGNLTGSEADQLILNVCTYALNKTDSLLCKEWRSSGCRRNVIKINYPGVVEVKRQGCLNGDARIKKLEGLNASYWNIINYIDNVLKVKYYGISPELKANGKWTDISPRMTDVNAQIGAFSSSSAYKNYFSKISEIPAAFDKTTSSYSKVAEEFYTEVMSNLKSYYNNKYTDISRSSNKAVLQNFQNELRSAYSNLKTSCSNSGLQSSFCMNGFGIYYSEMDTKIVDLLEKLNNDGSLQIF